jgi:hypothetical protein
MVKKKIRNLEKKKGNGKNPSPLKGKFYVEIKI